MRMRVSIALVCVGMAGAAAAQGVGKGVNGGEVVVMEGHPIEFVAKGQEITFFILEDDGKSPTPTTGYSGRVDVCVRSFRAGRGHRFLGRLQDRKSVV